MRLSSLQMANDPATQTLPPLPQAWGFCEMGLMNMDEDYPVQTLRAKLEAGRLAAIEELAASTHVPALEGMQKLAIIQSALTAVVEEIERHRVKLGGGSEEGLR